MRRSIIFVLLAAIILLSSCSEDKEYLTRDIYAIDSVVSINIPAKEEKAEKLCNEVTYYIGELENTLSVKASESIVTEFNSTSGEFIAEGDFLDIMNYALDVAQKTDGAYDPTCLPLVKLWNIADGGYLPSETEVNMALSNVDYRLILKNDSSFSKGGAVFLDLSDIARGFILEKTVAKLSYETDYGFVRFGESTGVWGVKGDGSSWEIDIKDPLNTESKVGKVVLPEPGGYLCVSGDYESYFEKDGKKYHRIFDPKTGYPADNGIHSVAVYAKDATIGQALSSALFVMGTEKAIEFYESGIYEFEALFVTDEGVRMTKGMEEMFTYEN